jgi:hypothetical protein
MSESQPHLAAVLAFQPASASPEAATAIIEPQGLKEPLWQVYNCSGCGQTVHHAILHQGVTPFMLNCSCGGKFTSQGRTTVQPEKAPKMEWYTPGGREQGRLLKGARKGDLRAASTLDHIRQGGLMIRKVGENTELAPAVVQAVGSMPGRNTKCPCGSGEKFKRCCGAKPPGEQ